MTTIELLTITENPKEQIKEEETIVTLLERNPVIAITADLSGSGSSTFANLLSVNLSSYGDKPVEWISVGQKIREHVNIKKEMISVQKVN